MKRTVRTAAAVALLTMTGCSVGDRSITLAQDEGDASSRPLDAAATSDATVIAPAADASPDAQAVTSSDAASNVETGPRLSGDAAPDAAPCTSSADCKGGACLPNGDCEAAALTLSGHVQRYEFPQNAFYQGGVGLKATNVNPQSPPGATSASDGTYTMPRLPQGAFIDLELTWAQTTKVFLPAPLTQTRTGTNSLSGDTQRTYNVPIVSFDWLAQVAVDCGIFPTLDAARGDSTGALNPFWLQRSTVLGSAVDSSGHPVAGIATGDIQITLGKQVNSHFSPNDTDAHPARVCFLQLGSNGLVGSALQSTDSTGRFVMFRVRNETGTGYGVADVNVRGMAPAQVTFRSSGQTGAIQLVAGADYVPTPPRSRDFEADVYPLFKKYACRGCHSPGNPGYEQSVARGPSQLKADYSGRPDDVYAVLKATKGGDCSTTTALERVCTNDPPDSLLAHKPFAEPPGSEDHPTTLFYDVNDPDYQAIVQWIGQGAKR